MSSDPKQNDAARRLAMMFQQSAEPEQTEQEAPPASPPPSSSAPVARTESPKAATPKPVAPQPRASRPAAPLPAPVPPTTVPSSRPSQPTRASNPARPAMPGRAATPTPPTPAAVAPPVVQQPAPTPAPVTAHEPEPQPAKVKSAESKPQPSPAAAPKPTASKPAVSSGTAAAIRAKMLAQQIDIYRTMIPTCLVLGVSLPVLAGLWFAIDPTAVVRKLPVWIPVAAGATGLGTLAIGGLLMSKVGKYLQSKTAQS
jgi:hypothetical protein